VRLSGLASKIGLAVGSEASAGAARRERRREPRLDFCGHKLIIRERRSLGILHLRDLSTNGACGITDMPLAVGTVVFLELKKSHFYAAEVKWVRRMTIGMQLFRPIREETMEQLKDQNRARRRASRAAMEEALPA
jgi:hypothetical protein